MLLEPSEAWLHIKQTRLKEYINNTIMLILGVGSLSFILGTIPAWLVSVYQFPGRKFFEWALILPLAIPVYIMAYTYADMFSSTGLLKKTFGANNFLLFEFKSLWGAILAFAFSLYPYIYFIAKNSFKQQAVLVLGVSRLFNYSHIKIFTKVALPLAFPAFSAGTLLVIMEVLSDYGTVHYCTTPTFTVGIFQAWYSFEDSQAAMRLSALLLCPAFTLWFLRWLIIRNKHYHVETSQFNSYRFGNISGFAKFCIFTTCSTIFFFTFVLPVGQLSYWAWQTASQVIDNSYLHLVKNSILLALSTASIALTIAVIITYTVKIRTTRLNYYLCSVSKSGYTLPAAVIAISAMTMCKWYDDSIGMWTNTALSNTLFALMFGYIVRFLAVAFEPVNTGFRNIGENITHACFSLGSKPKRTLFVHLQMMKPYLLSALVLIFIDILKEFNLTFIVGPTFQTLATDSYSRAISDEAIPHSSCAAMTIILISSFFLLFGKMSLDKLGKKT